MLTKTETVSIGRTRRGVLGDDCNAVSWLSRKISHSSMLNDTCLTLGKFT